MSRNGRRFLDQSLPNHLLITLLRKPSPSQNVIFLPGLLTKHGNNDGDIVGLKSCYLTAPQRCSLLPCHMPEEEITGLFEPSPGSPPNVCLPLRPPTR